jgi:hypothetical protein
MHHFLNQNIDSLNETFRLFERGSVNGVINLDPILTINGVSVAPTLRYKGGDAGATNWPAWGYGETLDIVAGTAPTYNAGSPLLGANDDSVQFNKGGYYQAGNNTFGDITTEDFVVELVFRANFITNVRYCHKRDSSNYGYELFTDSGQPAFFSFLIGDSGGYSAGNFFQTLTPGCWYHLIAFFDRSGSAIGYLNGAAGAATAISTRSGSISTNVPFKLGSNGASAHMDGCIAYYSQWKRDAWLDSHLQPTIALERFNRLIGLIPQVAKGTSTPVTQTRSTTAYLDKVESGARYLYNVGAGWLRIANRVDANSESINGYLPEASVTNKLTYSDLYPSWTLIDSTDHFDEVLVDGSMEAVDTSAWTAVLGATLTKEAGTPHSGTQCLRVAYGGTNHPIAKQICLTVGNTYRVTGWARGDGNAKPYFYLGVTSSPQWMGTTSTDWQYFDFISPAYLTNYIYLQSYYTGGACYCEWDDIQISEVTETAPNKQIEMMSFVASTNDGEHGVSQSALLTAATYTYSCYAKKGDKDWLYLAVKQSTPILADGDMEAADVTSWSVGGSATLTKETTTPHGGTNCLRVAYNGTSNPFAYQIPLTIGKTYRIQGWMRSDGSKTARIYNDGAMSVDTASASWTEVDVTWTVTATNLRFYCLTTAAGYAEFDDITITEVGMDGYFDLANGVTGTIGAGCTGYMEDWGNGIYRCGLTHTAAAKNYTHYLQSANADQDLPYAGDGETANIFVWGAQSENNDYMTSPISTTTAVATRTADVLTYAASDGNIGGVGSDLQGTVESKILIPDFTPSAFSKFLVTLSDGGSSTDYVGQYLSAGADIGTYINIAGAQANVVANSNSSENVITKGRSTWKTDDVKTYVDGVLGGIPDTSASIPDEIDQIDIGMAPPNSSQCNCLISDIKLC